MLISWCARGEEGVQLQSFKEWLLSEDPTLLSKLADHWTKWVPGARKGGGALLLGAEGVSYASNMQKYLPLALAEAAVRKLCSESTIISFNLARQGLEQSTSAADGGGTSTDVAMAVTPEDRRRRRRMVSPTSAALAETTTTGPESSPGAGRVQARVFARRSDKVDRRRQSERRSASDSPSSIRDSPGTPCLPGKNYCACGCMRRLQNLWSRAKNSPTAVASSPSPALAGYPS